MSIPSRPLTSVVCALGLALVLVPTEARAQGISINPGIFVSFSFGDKLNVGMGVDLRALPGPMKCYDAAGGPGVFLQLSVLNFAAIRAAAGLYLEGERTPSKSFAPNGEIGWTYRSALGEKHPGGHGLQAGIGMVGFDHLDASLRGTAFLTTLTAPTTELTAAIGARPRPQFLRQGGCIDGRPLFVDEELRHASLVPGSGWG